MAFERIKSEIAMLLAEMENQPQDLWELHEMTREKLVELRALGLPLPQDMVELEKKLNRELELKDK
jgi:hypothetical protein